MPFCRLDQIIDDRCNHRRGDKVLWWRGEWWSGGAFLGLVDQCTKALRQSGFSSGQRLALLLPNSPVFLALVVATWRLGGTVAPLNPLAGPKAVLQALEFARPFAVVVPQETSDEVKKGLLAVTEVISSSLEDPSPRRRDALTPWRPPR
ncbi:MAG TPA: AMP-binding protein [Synergistaceae bacterium]|nr:AMP-binding protein [Synergistaceae bacterium]